EERSPRDTVATPSFPSSHFPLVCPLALRPHAAGGAGPCQVAYPGPPRRTQREMAGIVTMLNLRAAWMRSKNARHYCVGDAGGPSTLRGVLSPHSSCRGDTTNHALP